LVYNKAKGYGKETLMGEKTLTNLRDAFAGESQANRKYLAFAAKAEREGYAQVARLFRAAAESETVHALKHLNVMKGVGSTPDNLNAAINGETYEFEQMYPGMIRDAEAEAEKSARISFWNANEVEKEHAVLFKQALEALGSNDAVEYWICGNCGHVHLNEAPEKCPVCQAPKSMFKKID